MAARGSDPHGNLLGLQAMRGLAAFLVVLHHSAVTMALPKYMDFVILGGLMAPLGRAGVDLFFVLSGFIIYYVHHRDIGLPQRLPRYAFRRLVRIYPTYWVVLLLLVAILYARNAMGLGEPPTASALIRSALLIPFTTPGEFTIVSVAWTLSHELLFYTLFGIAILNRRFGLQLFALWFVALVAARFAPSLPPPLNFFLHVKNLEFFFGIAVAKLLIDERLRPSWSLFALGATIFVATAVVELHSFDFEFSTAALFYGLGAAAMIFAAASLELERRLPKVPALLLLLGAASYSIYLIHFTVVVALVKLAHRFGLSGVPTYLGIAIAASSVGLVLYFLVERPVLTRSRRYFSSARSPPVAALTPAAARASSISAITSGLERGTPPSSGSR